MQAVVDGEAMSTGANPTAQQRLRHALALACALASLQVSCARPPRVLGAGGEPRGSIGTALAGPVPSAPRATALEMSAYSGCVIIEQSPHRVLRCWGGAPECFDVITDAGPAMAFSASEFFPASGRGVAFPVLCRNTRRDFATPGSVVKATAGVEPCLLLGDGTVQCGGLGGAFGPPSEELLGRRSHDFKPMSIRGQTLALSAGDFHSCALATTGVWCWGSNAAGQCGLPAGSPVLTPTLVPDSEGVVSVACGRDFTCVVRANGRAECWGALAARMAELVDPASRDAVTPEAFGSGGRTRFGVDGLHDAVRVVAGGGHACALLRDATVGCWGSGFDGELGGLDHSIVFSPSPIKPRVRDVVDLGAGSEASCAIVRSGKLFCWGTGAPYAHAGDRRRPYWRPEPEEIPLSVEPESRAPATLCPPGARR